jgi:gliding motility-associated-like protein
VTNGDEIDPDGDGTPGPNGTDPNDPCSLNIADQSVAPSQAWLDADCDGDGVTNGDEIDPDGDGTPGPNGTDPNDPCSLNIADQSVAPSQAWLDADCDGDGVTNGDEIDGGSNPFDPCDPNSTLPGCSSGVVVPQAFTPDGDGTNELFVITGIENYPQNKLTFYNRWGNEVFYAEGYSNDWDGTANRGIILGDGLLPTATYYYILDLNGDGSEILKGYVYIKR